MAIRFKHQVGAGIIGAYASGVAKSQQRRQKYALDLLQQERQHQMGMEERIAPFKYRAALGVLGGGLGGGGRAGAIGGEWADPMAGALTPQAKVQMNAQRRANARARQMGRPAPYPEADPQFTPDLEMAAKKEGVRRGDLVLSEPAKRQLRKLDADRVEAMKLSPEQRAEAEELIEQQRRDIINSASRPDTPDVGEAYNRNVRYLDPATGFTHGGHAPGRTPVQMVDGVPTEIPTVVAQRREQEKKEVAWAAQQKATLTDAKKRLEAYNKDKKTTDPDKTLTEFMGEVEEDYRTAGIPLVPNPSAAQPDAAPGGGMGGAAPGGGMDSGPVTDPVAAKAAQRARLAAERAEFATAQAAKAAAAPAASEAAAVVVSEAAAEAAATAGTDTFPPRVPSISVSSPGYNTNQMEDQLKRYENQRRGIREAPSGQGYDIIGPLGHIIGGAESSFGQVKPLGQAGGMSIEDATARMKVRRYERDNRAPFPSKEEWERVKAMGGFTDAEIYVGPIVGADKKRLRLGSPQRTKGESPAATGATSAPPPGAGTQAAPVAQDIRMPTTRGASPPVELRVKSIDQARVLQQQGLLVPGDIFILPDGRRARVKKPASAEREREMISGLDMMR